LKDIDAVLGRLAKGRVVKVTSTALSITANATWGTSKVEVHEIFIPM
jgi:hypothetical protein